MGQMLSLNQFEKSFSSLGRIDTVFDIKAQFTQYRGVAILSPFPLAFWHVLRVPGRLGNIWSNNPKRQNSINITFTETAQQIFTIF
jgi:hypothetical protein